MAGSNNKVNQTQKGANHKDVILKGSERNLLESVADKTSISNLSLSQGSMNLNCTSTSPMNLVGNEENIGCVPKTPATAIATEEPGKRRYAAKKGNITVNRIPKHKSPNASRDITKPPEMFNPIGEGQRSLSLPSQISNSSGHSLKLSQGSLQLPRYQLDQLNRYFLSQQPNVDG